MKKVYWSRGIIRTTSMLLFLAAFIILIFGSIVEPVNATKEGEFIEVVVAKNDTLWSLAQRYGNNQIDLRKLVYQIKELNQVSHLIQPGQLLYIPLP